MDIYSFSFKGTVWRYQGPAGWYFVSLPLKESKKVKELSRQKVGFGFVPVEAEIQNVKWETTLFPTKEGKYLIAIKAAVRNKTGVLEGEEVKISCVLK